MLVVFIVKVGKLKKNSTFFLWNPDTGSGPRGPSVRAVSLKGPRGPRGPG